MKKHIYAIIALASIAGPLAMSFDQRVYFIQFLPAVLIATLSIGALYIIWDILVTKAGHWRFNDETVGSERLFHLPPGEWLFFLLIPYACLFIFEVVAAYFGSGTAQPQLNWINYVLAAVFALFSILAFINKKGYTSLAMLSAVLYFLASGIFTPGALLASGYLISLGLMFVVFVIVNGLYTSIPTIFYNEKAILGPRVGTIPIEDFAYNLSYLGLSLTVYLVSKSLLGL